jgi:hypothetical protein
MNPSAALIIMYCSQYIANEKGKNFHINIYFAIFANFITFTYGRFNEASNSFLTIWYSLFIVMGFAIVEFITVSIIYS